MRSQGYPGWLRTEFPVDYDHLKYFWSSMTQELQLWPFMSYNWLFLWGYTLYKWGYFSTYNWNFGQ